MLIARLTPPSDWFGGCRDTGERYPASRWREAQPGFRNERENLAGDAKRKGPSGPNRKAESTDTPGRAEWSWGEGGRVIGDESGQPVTRGARSSTEGGSLQSMARAGRRESIESGPVRSSG